ncbi:MAG: Hpt domain-containing protein [Alphaproteobacteria bacterium]|nr:MAG: Hpt domain-containing protein [Alphaproteobacteria bacterium]
MAVESDWDETVVLDDRHLSGFTMGDEDLERQVLQIFSENAPGYLDTLKSAECESWKSDAHKLKGAARSIGAWRLARAAERAEFMGNPRADDPRRQAVLVEMQERLGQLLGAIETRCQALAYD